MKGILLNYILPRSARMYVTIVDSKSIEEAGLSNIGFKFTISDILKKHDFDEEKSNNLNSISGYNSKVHSGKILVTHNANKFENNQKNYGLTYTGLEKQIAQAIDDDIHKIEYLKCKN